MTGPAPRPSPPVICVVGWKDSGKTTLAVALAAELAARGRRVLTAKHGHGVDLDTPGTDSWRHRHEAGAVRVALVGPEGMAVMGSWGPDGEPALREVVARYLSDAEIVVAEGWKSGPEPKVEVFRRAAHDRPIYAPGAARAETFLAVVTDDPSLDLPVPVLSLDDPEHAARVADLVEARLLD